jgi:hypothetical protein
LFGYGYAITGLRINSANTYVGLFGIVDSAVIQDVTLIDARVTGTATNASVGGIAGNASASTIARVHVAGQVRCTGGNCFPGGIVGSTGGVGIINQSSSSASVQGTNYAGGAVGYLTGNTVIRTYATGPATCTATNCFAGGLVGRTSGGAVNLSFATGAVVAAAGSDSRAGGLIALTETATTISRSYATGAVTGGASGIIAALIGQHNSGGAIDQTFAVGRVTSTGATTGGLISNAGGTPVITNSYWDTQTTGQSTSAAGTTGLTTIQLRAALPTGFGNAWAITANRSYPFLNDFAIDFASTLATLVRANKVFVFLPISQLDVSQYITAPAHADGAALATVYTMVARGIGITQNVATLKNVKIDRFFWDDATQTTTWQGPVTTFATLGTLTAIPAGTPLTAANVVGAMTPRQLVILRGIYRKSDGTNATHWMLGTLYTRDTNNTLSAVLAHDPMTGQQVEIDPTTKNVLSENFPLTSFRVNGYQPVTLN